MRSKIVSSLVPVCLLSSQCTAGVWGTRILQEEKNRHWNSSENGFGLPLLFWVASSTFSLAPNFTHSHTRFSSIIWPCAGTSLNYCTKRVSHRVCPSLLVNWIGFLEAVSVSTIRWSIVQMFFFSDTYSFQNDFITKVEYARYNYQKLQDLLFIFYECIDLPFCIMLKHVSNRLTQTVTTHWAPEAQPPDDRKQTSSWRQQSEYVSCRSNANTCRHRQSDAIYGRGSEVEIHEVKKNQERTNAQTPSLFIQTITFKHWITHTHIPSNKPSTLWSTQLSK